MAQKDTITTRFKVDISDLKKGISEAYKQIKLANAQFKATSSGMDNWQKSSEGLNAKLKQLNTILEQEKIKLKNYKDEIKRLNEAEKENGKRATELKNKLQELTEQGVKKSSTEYKKYKTALNECEKEQLSNRKQADDLTITMTNQQGTVNKLEKDIRNYTKQLDNLDKEQDELNSSTKNLNDGFTVMKASLANLVSDGLKRAIDKVKELSKETLEVGLNFDSAMSKVSAISGATGEDLQKLRDKAKELGKATKFTATEVAEGFNYMAMAGWKTEDMLDGIDGILNLAAASGADLATTSDIVTDALTALGYSAKDAGKLANVMAVASANANTNVEMMGETFKYVGSIAGSLGYSMEDTAIAIGLMANSGVKATQAGTSLRSIMSRIATNTAGAKDAMNDLGIEVVNSDGSMRNFTDVIGDLRVKFKDLSSEEQANYAKTIAGQNALSGFLALANSSETDFNKLTNAVNNSSNAAENMAKTMQNDVKGDLTKFSSQIEGIQLQIYEKFAPSIRKGTKSVSKTLKDIDWDSFGNKAGKSFEKILDVFNWIIKHQKQVTTGLKLMISAFAISKINSYAKSMSGLTGGFKNFTKEIKNATVASIAEAKAQQGSNVAQVAGKATTTALTTATKSLWATMKANPVGALVTVGMALYSVYQKLHSKTNELTEVERRQKETIKEQSEQIKEAKNSWKELQETQQKSLDSGMTELTYYQNLYDELTNIVDANGKVKDGYESRASFIISTLNEALGTEITMTGNVIDKYGELTTSIDKLMDKKKAQIILDSQESAYSEALSNQSKATEKLITAEQELANAKELQREKTNQLKETEKLLGTQQMKNFKYIDDKGNEYKGYNAYQQLKKDSESLGNNTKKLKKNYDEQLNLVQGYAYTIGTYETNMALAHEGNVNDMITSDWNYVKQFQSTGDAKKAQLETDITNTQTYLDTLKSMRNTSNAEIIDKEIEKTEKLLANQQSEMEQYKTTTETSLNDVNNKWSTNLSKQLSKITGKKVEFKDAGNGLVQMYADGVKIGEPTAKDNMKKLAQNAIKEANRKNEAKTAGENLVEGVNDGITNQNKQNTVFSNIASFGDMVLSKLKNALKEHSPSKATEEDGINLLKGLGIGIDKQESPILKKIKEFGQSIVSTLNNELDTPLNTDFKGSLNNLKSNLSASSNNIRTGLSDSINNISSANNTTKNINNYTQNIYAPKQPSRIELYRQTRNLLDYVKKEG